MILRWWQVGLRNCSARARRTLLHSAAVIIACALVTAMTHGVNAVERTIWLWHDRWMGAVDLYVARPARQAFEQSAWQAIAADPDVAVASARLHGSAMLRANGRADSVALKGKSLPSDPQVHPQDLLTGRQLDDPAAREIILEPPSAERLGVGVGDTVEVMIFDDAYPFTVVGITHRPALPSIIPPTTHVPLAAAQQLLNKPGQVDAVYVQARPGVAPKALADRLGAELGGDFQFRTTADRSQTLLSNIRLLRANTWGLSSLVLLVAMFLIFATISCGMVRRIRLLGVLRCVGASRWQLAQLVLIESLPLALLGVAVGMPLGLGGSVLGVHLLREKLQAGWQLYPGGLALAAAGTILAALAGAAIPAAWAARVTPMEAFRMPARTLRPRWLIVSAGAGVVLLAVPWVYAATVTQPHWLIGGMVLLGIPSAIAGMFLVSPLLLATLGRALARLMGPVLRLGPALVDGQLRHALWRSAAVATAVGLCLAMVASAYMRTESIVAGVELPTDFPDMVVLAPQGLPYETTAEMIRRAGAPRWTGLNGFPVELEGAGTEGDNSLLQALMSWRHGNTWFLSVDPDRAEAVMQLSYVEGDAATARAKLQEGDYLVIPARMSEVMDRHVGDKMVFLRGDDRIEFEVAAVADSLAIEAVGHVYDLNELYLQNAAHTVIGSAESALQRFNQGEYSILLIDVESTEQAQQLAMAFQQAWPGENITSITSLRAMKNRMTGQFRSITQLIALVAGLLAAAVAAVGVANAMQANVYSRRHEMGVLHAVGMTRWQLIRLILGEALVVAVVGAVLGLAVGVLVASAGNRTHLTLTGQSLKLAVPAGKIALAAAMAIGATLLASLLAAGRAGRAKVLDLLR